MKRKTTVEEKVVFAYLNELRTSGATNMYGASAYIEDEFDMPMKEAKRFLTLWMKNFKADGNYEEIEADEVTA